MRSIALKTLLISACLSGVSFLGACGERLPEDPGLLADDLGIGLSVGISAQAARDVSPPDGLQLLVLTGEDFTNINPYEATDQQGELLAAIYRNGQHALLAGDAPVSDPVVTVKVFPREDGPSSLSLLGTNFAELDPDKVALLLGEPESRVESSDASIHLTYRFSSPRLARRNLAATFSHRSSGRCFAFELSLTQLSQ